MVANRTDRDLRHPAWAEWAWEWDRDREVLTLVVPTDPQDHPEWAWEAPVECPQECDLRTIIQCPVLCTCKDPKEALHDLRALRCITETGPHSQVLPASKARVVAASGMDHRG